MGEAAASGWEAFRLPNFNGDGDLDEWVCKLETFFDFTGKPEAQRIIYATNRLTGKAHALWRDTVQQGNVPSTWEGFKFNLRKSLENGGALVKPTNEVTTLQQGDSSVADYTRQFLELFVSGLNPQISTLVKGAETDNFQEAVNLAIACEKMLMAGKKKQENPRNMPAPKKQEQTAPPKVEVPPQPAPKTQEPPATPKKTQQQQQQPEYDDLDDGFMDVKRCFINYSDEADYGYWFKGTINNQAATFAHHNTSDNLISSSLVKRLDLLTVKCRPYMVEAMSGSKGYRGDTMVKGLEYELEGGLRNRMDFAIVDKLSRHDVLLGWPFFGHANKSVVFTKGGKVLVGPCTLQLYSGCPENQR